MAITKILARKGRLDAGIKYILNGDKTEEQILTAHLNCAPGRECRQMLDTKRAYGKTDRVAYRRTDTPLHIIQPTAFIGAGNCQPQGKKKSPQAAQIRLQTDLCVVLTKKMQILRIPCKSTDESIEANHSRKRRNS